MWLPTSVYEHIPQFWMLVGILFIGAALYLGFDYRLSAYYLGLGLLSVIWSGCVMALRSRRKKDTADESQAEDQAAE